MFYFSVIGKRREKVGAPAFYPNLKIQMKKSEKNCKTVLNFQKACGIIPMSKWAYCGILAPFLSAGVVWEALFGYHPFLFFRQPTYYIRKG